MKKKILVLFFVVVVVAFFAQQLVEARSLSDFKSRVIKTLDQKIIEAQQPQLPPEPPPPPPEQQNRAPYEPSNPVPLNGATEVGTYNVQLSWTGGDPDGDSVRYRVELTTIGSETVSVFDTVFATAVVGSLPASSTFLWKVIATDSYGSSTVGPIWSFTTKTPEPPLPPPSEWRILKSVGDYRLLQKDERIVKGPEIYLIDTLGIQKKGEEQVVPIGSQTTGPWTEIELSLILPANCMRPILNFCPSNEKLISVMWYKVAGHITNNWKRIFSSSKNSGRDWSHEELEMFSSDDSYLPRSFHDTEQLLFYQTPSVIHYLWTTWSANVLPIYSSYDGGKTWNVKIICRYSDYEVDPITLTQLIYGRKIDYVKWDEKGWIEVKVKILPKDQGPNFFYFSSNDYGQTWSLERKEK